MKIGVSGAVGSFSEEAGEKYINEKNLNDAEILQLISVENVLKSLDEGSIDIGIFPIENSNGGVVFEAINAMADHTFKIRDYFDIEVNHCLIVKKGTKPEEIKNIASHDQALRQCRAYLKRKWPEVNLIDYADTAKASKALSEGEFPEGTATISAGRCADIYDGIEILENKIQDLKYNYTTFLAVEKK